MTSTLHCVCFVCSLGSAASRKSWHRVRTVWRVCVCVRVCVCRSITIISVHERGLRHQVKMCARITQYYDYPRPTIKHFPSYWFYHSESHKICDTRSRIHVVQSIHFGRATTFAWYKRLWSPIQQTNKSRPHFGGRDLAFLFAKERSYLALRLEQIF